MEGIKRENMGSEDMVTTYLEKEAEKFQAQLKQRQGQNVEALQKQEQILPKLEKEVSKEKPERPLVSFDEIKDSEFYTAVEAAFSDPENPDYNIDMQDFLKGETGSDVGREEVDIILADLLDKVKPEMKLSPSDIFKKVETDDERGLIWKLDQIRSDKEKIQDALRIQSLEQKNENLEELSITDALTGLPSRRFYDAELENISKAAKRNKKPFTLILLDLDKFKSVNDTFGHPVGDILLKELANVIQAGPIRENGEQKKLRGQDRYARWGGEEFIIILPETQQEDALEIAEGYRKAIENITIKVGDKEIHPTGSFGVASGLDSKIVEENVDKALYGAKKSGRNKVIVFEEEKSEIKELALTN